MCNICSVSSKQQRRVSSMSPRSLSEGSLSMQAAFTQIPPRSRQSLTGQSLPLTSNLSAPWGSPISTSASSGTTVLCQFPSMISPPRILSQSAEEAFRELKHHFTTALILTHPETSWQLVVEIRLCSGRFHLPAICPGPEHSCLCIRPLTIPNGEELQQQFVD